MNAQLATAVVRLLVKPLTPIFKLFPWIWPIANSLYRWNSILLREIIEAWQNLKVTGRCADGSAATSSINIIPRSQYRTHRTLHANHKENYECIEGVTNYPVCISCHIGVVGVAAWTHEFLSNSLVSSGHGLTVRHVCWWCTGCNESLEARLLRDVRLRNASSAFAVSTNSFAKFKNSSLLPFFFADCLSTVPAPFR